MRQLIGAHTSVEVQWRALLFVLIGCAILLRLLYSTQVELLPEETYYWNYSRHLDVAYLDHPPMVAWLIGAGTALFGNTEFGVRFGALCCGAVTAFFVFRLACNLLEERSALLALALSQILPFFFLAGVLMTPDAPLTAAWAASLFFLERALVANRPRAWMWAGLTLGVGLLSKYTISLLGAAAFVFMMVDPASRRWFRRWEPYVCLLIAVAVFAPVIVWNAQHDWASFAFQTSRRLAEHPRFSLHKLIGAAVILLTPVGVVAVAIALIRKPQEGLGSDLARPWRFLRMASLLPVSVFVLFSLRHEVKLDWTGAPWVAALPLMAFGLGHPAATLPKATRRLLTVWPSTMAVMLMIYSAALYYLVFGIPGLGYTQHMELVPVEWRDFSVQIEGIADELRAKLGDGLLIVGMDRYAIASELAFYARDQQRSVARTSSGHLFDDVGLMYERWFPVNSLAGHALLLVAWDPAQLATARLGPYVVRLEPLQEGSLVRGGKLVRRYFYRVAHGYRYPRPNSREGGGSGE